MQIQFIGVFVEEEFFRPVKKGMKDAGNALGLDVSFTGDTGGDTSVVNRLIYSAVDSQVDGIAVDIIHPTSNNEAINYAMSMGVPVVAFNVDATNGKGGHLAFTQQNFIVAGMKLAKELINDIPSDATILLAKHDADVSALEDRGEGIKNGLISKNASFIEIITTPDANVAAERIETMLRENPGIAAIFCTGQADTEGAGLAVKKLNKQILVGGFDLSHTIIELVKEGYIKTTVDQQPYMQGYYPVLQLYLYIRFGIIPCNIDAGAALINKSNASEIIELSKKGYR